MNIIITNRHLVKDGDLLKRIEDCVEAGCKYIMLREKDLDDKTLLKLAISIKRITDMNDSNLIINNNLEIAKKIGAFGVQLSVDKFDESTRFEGQIGISVHSYDEAQKAIRLGADYLIASHMFLTDCKPGLKPKGVRLIHDIRASSSIPIVALGGLTPGNIHQIYDAGGDGFAIMSSAMTCNDMKVLIGELMNEEDNL